MTLKSSALSCVIIPFSAGARLSVYCCAVDYSLTASIAAQPRRGLPTQLLVETTGDVGFVPWWDWDSGNLTAEPPAFFQLRPPTPLSGRPPEEQGECAVGLQGEGRGEGARMGEGGHARGGGQEDVASSRGSVPAAPPGGGMQAEAAREAEGGESFAMRSSEVGVEIEMVSMQTDT